MDKADYLKHMQEYPDKYTQENYEKVKDFFGVIVLQTNCIDKRAEEIYSLYKKRWKIETFFNYFKNRVEISSLHLDDYYMSEGVSFIMLIVGLLESEFNEAIKKVGIKERTIDDILLDGRFIKIHWNRGSWYLENMKKSRQDMMNVLNVTYEEINNLK